jgi:6-phosphogluconolactonase/glucosamine-6-phosphate isomerase/deaminase
MIKYLTEELLKRRDQLASYKHKLKFLLCDERFVAFNSADSTYGEYVTRGLFTGLGIPEENLFPIKVDSANVNECAEEYESRLRPLLNSNNGFDFLLFGCGPDGHTCSLFPGHNLFVNSANYSDKIVVPISKFSSI